MAHETTPIQTANETNLVTPTTWHVGIQLLDLSKRDKLMLSSLDRIIKFKNFFNVVKESERQKFGFEAWEADVDPTGRIATIAVSASGNAERATGIYKGIHVASKALFACGLGGESAFQSQEITAFSITNNASFAGHEAEPGGIWRPEFAIPDLQVARDELLRVQGVPVSGVSISTLEAQFAA